MSAIADAVFGPLLWGNLRSVLLIVLVFAALQVLRLRGGAARHDAWLITIAACLLMPLLSASLPALSLAILPASETGFAPAAGATAGITEAEAAAKVADSALPAFAWPIAALFVYLAGAGLLLAKFARSLWRLARFDRELAVWPGSRVYRLGDELCRRLGIGRPVRYLRSERISSPVTWGVVVPRIALPAAAEQWPDGLLRNVLAHELSHVGRGDWLRMCLQRLALAFGWINPLVWFAVRQCALEAEKACDEFVLRTGAQGSDYAEQLVELMAGGRGTTVAGVALGDGDFRRRIDAILTTATEVPKMNNFRQAVLALSVVATAVVLAACQVTNGQTVDNVEVGLPQELRAEEQRLVDEAMREEAERVQALQAFEEMSAREREIETQRVVAAEAEAEAEAEAQAEARARAQSQVEAEASAQAGYEEELRRRATAERARAVAQARTEAEQRQEAARLAEQIAREAAFELGLAASDTPEEQRQVARLVAEQKELQRRAAEAAIVAEAAARAAGIESVQADARARSDLQTRAERVVVLEEAISRADVALRESRAQITRQQEQITELSRALEEHDLELDRTRRTLAEIEARMAENAAP